MPASSASCSSGLKMKKLDQGHRVCLMLLTGGSLQNDKLEGEWKCEYPGVWEDD